MLIVKRYLYITCVFVLVILTGCTSESLVVKENACQKEITKWRSASTNDVIERYKDLQLIDVHNHDANQYEKTLPLLDELSVDKVGISGYVSRKDSIITDELAWEAYTNFPERFYPFFSGIDIYSENGLELARKNLELGFMGIGEIAAQSFNSPILRTADWKANDPMDGNLPQLYEIAGEYHVPVLLHIDPPSGTGIEKLEEALQTYPDTIFIFGHMNVANRPEDMDKLMEKYSNLYMDVYAGYTAYNTRDSYELIDLVDVIEKYSDRVLVSTDSGVEIEYKDAIKAMYELIDVLSPETACKVAHENFEKLMDQQPATATQKTEIANLAKEADISYEEPTRKHEANKLLFDLMKKVQKDEVTYGNLTYDPIIESKSLAELTEAEMVTLGRNLLENLNEGLWGKDATIKAKENWEQYYNSIYFPDALTPDVQKSYQKMAELNHFDYETPQFEKETVTKEEYDFIYNVEMHETMSNTSYITKYRVWIGYDLKTNTYKIKAIIGADIQR